MTIQEAILTELRKSPGTTIPVAELVQVTGFGRGQVLGAIQGLSTKGLIERPGNALVRYMGDAKSTRPIFELLAKTPTGDLVLQDKEGQALIVRPI